MDAFRNGALISNRSGGWWSSFFQNLQAAAARHRSHHPRLVATTHVNVSASPTRPITNIQTNTLSLSQNPCWNDGNLPRPFQRRLIMACRTTLVLLTEPLTAYA